MYVRGHVFGFLGGLRTHLVTPPPLGSSTRMGQVVRPPSVVHPFSTALNRWMLYQPVLRVNGENFSMAYTELYFDPPLPEESIKSYEVREETPSYAFVRVTMSYFAIPLEFNSHH